MTFVARLNILRGNLMGLSTLHSYDHESIFRLFYPTALVYTKIITPFSGSGGYNIYR